jgi:hypothetical protein
MNIKTNPPSLGLRLALGVSFCVLGAIQLVVNGIIGGPFIVVVAAICELAMAVLYIGSAALMRRRIRRPTRSRRRLG